MLHAFSTGTDTDARSYLKAVRAEANLRLTGVLPAAELAADPHLDPERVRALRRQITVRRVGDIYALHQLRALTDMLGAMDEDALDGRRRWTQTVEQLTWTVEQLARHLGEHPTEQTA